jgi:GT2 family glycosyltransferase
VTDAAARVAAIVVTHDSGGVLERCVAALLDAAEVAEIVIVDNASHDGAPQALAGRPRVRVLANADNRGFGAACNQGAAVTCAAFLVFVNPDCFVARDTLARLAAVAAADPTIGLVGVDMRDAEGRREDAARRADPTLARVIGELLARVGVPTRSRVHLQPTGAPLEVVDAVSGALMLVPRGTFAAIGGFDEGYRLHVEDLDLCHRIRTQGLRVVVAADVQATHLKGTSSSTRPLFVAWHKHRGLARYWLRHGAGGGMLVTAFAILLLWLRFALLSPWYAWSALRSRPAPAHPAPGPAAS